MCLKTLCNLLGVFSISLLIGVSSQCLCLPDSKINQIIPVKVTSPVNKISSKSAISNASSALVVVFIPFRLGKLFGIGPWNMQQALHEFQTTGKANPYGYDSYATIIQSQSQKNILLGMLDTKETPVKSSEGDSEILITEQSWRESIIIDQYGVVTDGSRVYKLSPPVLRKMHILLNQIFASDTKNVPTGAVRTHQ